VHGIACLILPNWKKLLDGEKIIDFKKYWGKKGKNLK
jgi:hypothetical protein